MKIFLATVLVILFDDCVTERVPKSELTPDEQNNLLLELNRDRMESAWKTNIYSRALRYDTKLESMLSGTKEGCGRFMNKESFIYIAPLKYDKIGRDGFGVANIGDPRIFFFNPYFNSIGCSKTFRCSDFLSKNYSRVPELGDKTFEVYGGCALDLILEGSHTLYSNDTMREVISIGIPSTDKYADILGVTGPSDVFTESFETTVASGRIKTERVESEDEEEEEENNSNGKVFNILLVPFFLVFYV